MPVDYSKWDNLELSDDSDVEVHPNVDKRSFIRAKQSQIHMERMQRKHEIETLHYERQINDGLAARIQGLRDALRARAADVQADGANAAELAFQAVLASTPQDPAHDQPPPRPEGVHTDQPELPTYTKMMATVLDQVHTALRDRNVPAEQRFAAMVDEIGQHWQKVEDLQSELRLRLGALEALERKKITSDSYHTGFDSTHVNHTKGEASATAAQDKDKDKAKAGDKVELLNPNYDINTGKDKTETSSSSGNSADDDLRDASPTAVKFSEIQPKRYQESFQFLMAHPEIVTEAEHDGLMLLAFDAGLHERYDRLRQVVHQALLLQYCRALGRDGVQLFFKRMTTPGHRAQKVFFDDVEATYARIRNRTAEIRQERKDRGELDDAGNPVSEVERIQLTAVEPGTEILISVPPAAAAEGGGETKSAERVIFEGFPAAMQEALTSGSLDRVNEVLETMTVAEAEDMVEKLSEAGCLSISEKILDTTTEEGRAEFEALQAEAGRAVPETEAEPKAEPKKIVYDDPE